jgi:hypothetical protein
MLALELIKAFVYDRHDRIFFFVHNLDPSPRLHTALIILYILFLFTGALLQICTSASRNRGVFSLDIWCLDQNIGSPIESDTIILPSMKV